MNSSKLQPLFKDFVDVSATCAALFRFLFATECHRDEQLAISIFIRGDEMRDWGVLATSSSYLWWYVGQVSCSVTWEQQKSFRRR